MESGWSLAEVLKTESELETLKKGSDLLAQRLQHHGSSDCWRVAYTSFEIPIHLACSQEVQTSHWRPRWLDLTGAEHTPQGYFHLFRPGLTLMSPARNSSQMIGRERLGRRCEHFEEDTTSQLCNFRLTGVNLTECGGSPLVAEPIGSPQGSGLNANQETRDTSYQLKIALHCHTCNRTTHNERNCLVLPT